jgi:methyl-accepting chemotaxis protein
LLSFEEAKPIKILLQLASKKLGRNSYEDVMDWQYFDRRLFILVFKNFNKLPRLKHLHLPRLPHLKPLKEWKFHLQLRVFHKILLILILLLVFIGLEGYLNLQNIDRMQAINQKVFLQSNVSLESLNEIKNGLVELERDYALKVAGIDTYILGIDNLASSLSNLQIKKQNTDATDQIGGLAAKLDEVKELIALPVSKDHYEQIKQLLFQIELEINSLLNEAKTDSINAMSHGNQFVDNTKKVTLIILGLGCVIALGLGSLVAASISRPLKKTMRMIQEMTRGHLGMRLNIRRKDEIGLMAQSMDGFADDLQNIVIGTMQQIAAGNLTAVVEPLDDRDEIRPALRTTIEVLRRLAGDTKLLSQAAVEGRFETRAAVENYQGDYRLIVEGFNATLNTVVGGIDYQATEITRLASNLQRLAIGDLNLDLTVADGDECTAAYRDNFTKINKNLETLRASLETIQEMAVQVARGDVSQLEKFSRLQGERSEHDRLIPSFVQMMETIQDMAKEVNRLTQAATEGKLETRGDVAKFEGHYRAIVAGINQTLDTMGAPLEEALQILDRMADNDYTCTMSTAYHGAFQQLAEAVNRVQETLNRTLREINISAEQIAVGSKQVADGSEQVSQGATAQAGSVQELSATIMQIAAQTRENAGSADNANQVALTAKEMAEHGNQQMQAMLRAMAEIQESSEGIFKIIKVIDEIAFQTNMLALNAAIEAARAGQYGRGFAVVAEEVRSLAARSSDAAKETAEMIENSIKKVKDGTGITKTVATALTRIVEGVTQATGLVGKIALASEEQATGINQVTQGIDQVSRVVQANTATAEESAATCQELSGQAAALKEMVIQFQLKEEAVG